MKPGQDTKYTYATGRIRVLESRLLNRQTFERLIETPTLEEASFVLREYELSTNIDENLAVGYKIFDELSLDKKLKKVFRIRYDLHNLRAVLIGLDESHFSNLGLFGLETIRRMANKERLKGVYFDYILLMDMVKEGLSKEGLALQLLNFTIDKVMVSYIYEVLKRSAFLKDYFKRYIDLKNLNFYFRFKKNKELVKNTLLDNGYIKKELFIRELDTQEVRQYETIISRGREYAERNGDFSFFEKLCDDYLLEHLKPAKYLSFGIEPLFSYVVAIEYQARNINAILFSKRNNIAKEYIRENLRESYV